MPSEKTTKEKNEEQFFTLNSDNININNLNSASLRDSVNVYNMNMKLKEKNEFLENKTTELQNTYNQALEIVKNNQKH